LSRLTLKDSDDGVCCTEFTEFFWTFSIVLYSKKTGRFGNWICFHPQVKVGEKTPLSWAP
jgi:hypothetical protein